MRTFVIRFAAVIVIAAFVFRDANPISSGAVVLLLFLAATVHHLRQQDLRNQSLWDVVRTITLDQILLLFVEWLFIAIVAHFVVNELHTPYQQFREWVSCAFDCYKTAYLQ